jgi:glycosyltransferase involved in cell wall biosynthesis
MNILFLAYYYPPIKSIACVRTEAISRELENQGFSVRIITSINNKKSFDDGKIYRVSHIKRNKSKNKIFRWLTKKVNKYFSGLLNFPDMFVDWIPLVYKKACKIIEVEEIDVIISTASPYSSHVIASMLKRKYKIPWIADFRDLWTQNCVYNHGKTRYRIEQLFEKYILKSADCLTTVSKPLCESLKMLHKKKVIEITNGFTEIDLNEYKIQSKLPLLIIFAGNIWKNYKFEYQMFFSVLSELIKSEMIDESRIQIEFYGEFSNGEKLINLYSIESIVKLRGSVDRSIIIQKLAEADVLLFFAWTDLLFPGIYSGKIFEYISVKRPIISIGGIPGDVVPELLETTEVGFSCFSKEQIKNKILQLIKEKELTKVIKYQGKETEIKKYLHSEIGKKFAKIIYDCTKKEE